jgi:glycosyltransferase involved in cell wall biosynthesis
MRILYDYEIWSIQKYGGASRYYYEMIRRMADMPGTELVVYMGKYINQYGLEAHKNKFTEFCGSEIRHIPRTKLLSIKLQKPFFEKYADRQNVNLFHQTFYNDYKFKKSFRKIITVLDFTHEKMSGNFVKLDKTADLKKKAILSADGIICISGTTKKDLLELYDVPEKRVTVIYLANSLRKDVSNIPFCRDPYILYVGDRRSYKNFGLMAEVFSKNEFLREFKLICFGGGAFTRAESVMIAFNKLNDNFVQMDGNESVMSNIYANALAFVYPSHYEGFGIPMLEAMYYGCPVAASNSSCLPEIGGDAALYFDPNSSEELADKLKSAIFDSNIKQELSVKGKLREKEFSWDECANNTQNFYKEIAGFN